jgi:hypothetical protein
VDFGNKKFKDSLIRKIFSTPDKAMELYNAVTGKNLSSDTLVEMKNVEPVLLSSIRNDLSFIIDGRLAVFLEHQSTINRNMPLRMLQYLLVFYEANCEIGRALYKEKRISLPKPEFYVLYNGNKNQPEKQMRLSEAFAGLEEGEAPQLELVVNIININYGENPDVMEKSESLNGYAFLVAKQREYKNAGNNTDMATRLACEYCIKEGILSEFLLNLKFEELIFMLNLEYDEALAKEVAREEGFEDGVENLIERMIRKGKSVESIVYDTDVPLSKVIIIKERIAAEA